MIPGRDWTSGFLSSHFTAQREGSWKRLRHTLPALRHNFRHPEVEDWQEKLGFVVLPSLESRIAYSVDHELDISSLFAENAPNLSHGHRVDFYLEDSNFAHSPSIEWWNWGDLEGDLLGKKLGYVGDPLLNDKNREDESKLLPADLVLGYENWRDFEDEESNPIVHLEVEFDVTPVSVWVVEQLS
ncbi:hypothetical protein K458DRAFT_454579 [Lentithecium fluviatile CBS 122367]|uniref:Uncharacterized protein n=1 Tax=Lentithecium fluviatile CBS 122367 TaxID=1168545 RepID=A0A6G1JJD6_9PLEO|nr:hypothetical protein K458DRAFT_454579 [Lentithecium fluviatile CBS 122367]